MKVLFAHDHKFRLINGKYYTPGGLPNEVLIRYKEKFGALTVLTRIYEEEGARESYREINTDGVSFVEYSQGKYKRIKYAVKNTDVLVARLPSLIGYIAVHYAQKYNTPYIIEAVGDPSVYGLYGNLKGKLIAPVMTYAMKYQVKHAKFVIYVSRRFLQEMYPTKGYSVGCPDVYLEQPSLKVLNKRLSKISEQNAGLVVLGLIGSLNVSYRGHETLLKAAHELSKKNIYCEIRFLGGGNGEKWISIAEQLGVNHCVVFSGILPSGSPVLKWIDDIDILVMPTQQETLGRAIIEAMSRGCPVIGSIETAISEQIGSDCLCEANDYATVANLVERMIRDREYMSYCALENFYRSHKYTNKQTDKIRDDFFNEFILSANQEK